MGDSAEKTLTGAPWWAKLAGMFGGPTLVLLVVLYGVWSLATNIGLRMAQGIESNQQVLIKQSSDTLAMLNIQAQLVQVVRANCFNAAKDEPSRERCMGYLITDGRR